MPVDRSMAVGEVMELWRMTGDSEACEAEAIGDESMLVASAVVSYS